MAKQLFINWTCIDFNETFSLVAWMELIWVMLIIQFKILRCIKWMLNFFFLMEIFQNLDIYAMARRLCDQKENIICKSLQRIIFQKKLKWWVLIRSNTLNFGIHVNYNWQDWTICLSQKKYIENILKHYGVGESKLVQIPSMLIRNFWRICIFKNNVNLEKLGHVFVLLCCQQKLNIW